MKAKLSNNKQKSKTQLFKKKSLKAFLTKKLLKIKKKNNNNLLKKH